MIVLLLCRFGLPKVDGNNLEVGFETGNFNIPVVRLGTCGRGLAAGQL